MKEPQQESTESTPVVGTEDSTKGCHTIEKELVLKLEPQETPVRWVHSNPFMSTLRIQRKSQKLIAATSQGV